MCGIAGVLDPRRETLDAELNAMAGAMMETLAHRGPDDWGLWADAPSGVGFGHRRLAVVDLSPEGHQPIRDRSGRYVLVFNGEIYNHRELRSTLEGRGHVFRGHSDTEVLVEAVAEWGLDATLPRLNGMFALALWDTKGRCLHLVRDRLGEKPLYYGWAGRYLVFGSELKALRAFPHFIPEIDAAALAEYLRNSFIPSPGCIYRRVRKLPPGTALTVPWDRPAPLADPVPYWSVADSARRGREDPFRGSFEEATEALSALLTDAVRLRMHADVPLAAFLSGGVDSSVVVALMAAQATQPVHTFTVAMPDVGFDESADAAAVARHLGTAHTEARLSPGEALALVPTIPVLYDEPFADPSQLPTALVCRLARRDVTVAITGDGGDEVFGGYNRYVLGELAWTRLGRLPRTVRRPLAQAMGALPAQAWDSMANRLGPVLPRSLRVRNPGDKLEKLRALLRLEDASGLHAVLAHHWRPGDVQIEPPDVPDGAPTVSGLAVDGIASTMMLLDQMTTLPDDMLTKVDRASMAASLEARVPLLDHRVVELAWRLPPEMHIRDGRGKWLLRRVLSRHVPDTLIDRPKMGFDPPLGSWLRGPLRSWAGELLDPDRLAAEGFLRPGPIQRLWAEHLSGRRNHDYRLWIVLMFEAWLAQEGRSDGVVRAL